MVMSYSMFGSPGVGQQQQYDPFASLARASTPTQQSYAPTFNTARPTTGANFNSTPTTSNPFGNPVSTVNQGNVGGYNLQPGGLAIDWQPGDWAGSPNTTMDPNWYLQNQAYTGMAENFQNVMDNPITAQSLYDAGVNLMNPQYEKAQNQNVETLNKMGILTSGAGYGENTPYDQTNQNYMHALQTLALQSNIQAPQMQQSLFNQALGNLQQQAQYSSGYTLSSEQLAAQLKAMQDAQDAASAAANGGLWSSIGSMVGGLGGAIGGSFLGVPPQIGGGLGSMFGGGLGGLASGGN